jgi:hypothetical protein
MLRSWMLGGIGGLLIASTLWARPGTVKTQDGQTFVGDVVDQGDQIIVDQKGIHTSIARDNLRSITYSETLEQEYHRRLNKLTQYDVPGRVDIAQWLFENKSYALALDVLDGAKKIQPHNLEVADMIRTVNRQMMLDDSEARKHAPVQLAAADNNPRTGAPSPAPPGAGGRLLNPDEINFIRQSEWLEGQKTSVVFRNDVRRKYIAQQGVEPQTFNKLSPQQQAWAIVQNGTPEMKKDVILGDTPSMLQFRKVESSILANSCAACHTPDKNAGGFSLHLPADNEAATYTNFLILQRYKHPEGDRTYSMIDRETPTDSLLIQFSLPSDIGNPPHPKNQNYKGAVRTRNDPRLKMATDWVSALNPIVPDYSDINIDSAPKPATRPAATTPPATPRPSTPRSSTTRGT